jgi:hypothetical protein
MSNETRNNDRKELNFNQEVRTIISMMPPAISKRPVRRFIIKNSFNKDNQKNGNLISSFVQP